MFTLSVVILTKNEEKNIIDVIANAKKCTNNVFIVDSGSTDRTVDLANKHGAEVVFRKWDNDFAAQRNFALTKIQTDYVLYLDADERMSEDLIKSVKKVMDENVAKQYSFMRKIKAFGFEYQYGIFAPDEVWRLFPVQSVHGKTKCMKDLYVIYQRKNWMGWLSTILMNRGNNGLTKQVTTLLFGLKTVMIKEKV